jgi:hypothetical protein
VRTLSVLNKKVDLTTALLVMLIPVAFVLGAGAGSSQTHTTTLSYTSTETITSTVSSTVTETSTLTVVPTLFIFLEKECYTPNEKTLRGIVVLSDSWHNAQPLAGVTIEAGAYGSDLILGVTQTDANGEFSITLPYVYSYSVVYFLHAYLGEQYWGMRTFTVSSPCE